MKKQDLIKKINQLKESRKKMIFKIDLQKCRCCDFCKKNCPANAIKGEIGQPHKINPEKCLTCGSCESICPFKAVTCLILE